MPRVGASASPETPPPDGGRFKVLLVDDDLSVLRSLAAVLQFDVDVVTCTSAERALNLLREGQFHVVCSDYSMPGMDGLELFERIAQLPVRVACLLLTGSTHFGQGRSVDQYVLTKPTDPAHLSAVIAQLASATEGKRRADSMKPRPSR